MSFIVIIRICCSVICFGTGDITTSCTCLPVLIRICLPVAGRVIAFARGDHTANSTNLPVLAAVRLPSTFGNRCAAGAGVGRRAIGILCVVAVNTGVPGILAVTDLSAVPIDSNGNRGFSLGCSVRSFDLAAGNRKAGRWSGTPVDGAARSSADRTAAGGVAFAIAPGDRCADVVDTVVAADRNRRGKRVVCSRRFLRRNKHPRCHKHDDRQQQRKRFSSGLD